MQVPRDRVYRLSNTEDFYVFFRERGLSNDISFGQLKRGIDFVNRFGYLIPYAGYIVSATDGEVYGHHHRGMEKFLDQLYKDGRIETATLSEILATIEQGELVDPYSCSWASYEDDLRRGIPYALWQHPNNEIHKLQWELTNLAIETVNKFPNKESYNYNKARQVLDEGLHSCQYWWASATPWWSVEMIERGARTLLISIFLLREAPSYARVKAEELYEEIMDKAGVWNETGYAQKVKTEFLSTHPDIASELTFGEKKHTHKYLKEES